ncbi:hypothetical protein AVEN_199699-1 [Araneus ventricosus]|uniref:Uncharacterized protein n=1 Tax=Araneus ventricosus TaxID=182803 RepID=A0A4Y2GZA0_ARAVE|nr:hypothetical protein AVEN_199699-1 [Araneus ventricosus]
MRGRRISKQGLASPGGTIMVEVELPPPMIVRTSFAKGQAMASDGNYDSDLIARLIFTNPVTSTSMTGATPCEPCRSTILMTGPNAKFHSYSSLHF